MRAFRVGPLLVLLLAAACSAYGQQLPLSQPQPDLKQDYTESPVKPEISGFVRFSDGRGPAGPFVVRLETSSGSTLRQIRTGNLGEFEFPEVACGNYVLAVDVAGYLSLRKPIEQSFIPLGTIYLRLVKDDRVGAASANAAAEAGIPEKALKEYLKGQEASSNRKAGESIGRFRKAIEIYPAYDAAYVQLGLVYLDQRSFREAEKAATKAVSLNGKSALAYALLGSAYRQQEQYEKSVQALEQSLKLQEGFWRAQLELGQALIKLGRVSEAYPHLVRAHQLNPGSPQTHLELYNTLILRNDYRAALAELEEFLKMFPDSPLVEKVRRQHDALSKVVAEKR